MSKKSAQNIGLEKTKEKNRDHRNINLAEVQTSLGPHKISGKVVIFACSLNMYLYSSQEGHIFDGTPAAEGVSAEDMNRRRR